MYDVCTLGEKGSLTSLVLGDLVDDVLLAALAQGATSLGDVDLYGRKGKSRSVSVSNPGKNESKSRYDQGSSGREQGIESYTIFRL